MIIPYATGDMEGSYEGASGHADSTELVLERPRFSEFEKALVSIGVDQADARRPRRAPVAPGLSFDDDTRQTQPIAHPPGSTYRKQRSSPPSACSVGGKTIALQTNRLWRMCLDGATKVLNVIFATWLGSMTRLFCKLVRYGKPNLLSNSLIFSATG